MLEADPSEAVAHLVVLYPRENDAIDPVQYSPGYIETQIAERLEKYRSTGHDGPVPAFSKNWRAVLPRIRVQFVTWEEVLSESSDKELDAFYRLCLRFNKKT